MAEIIKMTVEEFHAALKAQGVSSSRHLAFICPACGTVQSMEDHVRAGATPEEAERSIAFSCFGRRTNAGSPRNKPDGKPCNWSLGGLFRIHEMIVIDDEGEEHPRFVIATPDQAKAHEASHG